MSRVSLLLLAALVASSLWLIRTSYESRRVFHALDSARAQAQALETDRQRLEAERQSQATPMRVERLARERLQMRNASAAVTAYVAVPASGGAR